MVLLGGAPGIGKTTVGARLLRIAAGGSRLVQWVDVDALWLHQPWRVDEKTKRMVQSNLAAVMRSAFDADVEVFIATWVFQGPEIQDLVRGLAPTEASVETIQLLVDEDAWRARWASGASRPPIDSFYEGRYAGAQSTPGDHVIDTTELDVGQVATAVAKILGL